MGINCMVFHSDGMAEIVTLWNSVLIDWSFLECRYFTNWLGSGLGPELLLPLKGPSRAPLMQSADRGKLLGSGLQST